ncbi:hypothetical protein LRLP16767_LRLP167_01003 [Limosilactobacillus reuteri]|uniref:Uncharacterized protein n=1 Tax=Limosilactobacillus reuteri TaxID=1598 RepID=A0A0U5K3Q6_LIMRT|nr:hypothetical protein LRLP16767_LRLP167_01003 [Limosilactobacillus reuteri]
MGLHTLVIQELMLMLQMPRLKLMITIFQNLSVVIKLILMEVR